ncbi:MAG: winged helix-turn-helix domain-containing protein [Thermoanaerobaculia bacterium]
MAKPARAGTPNAPSRKRRLDTVAGYLSDSRALEFDRLVYERVRLGILSALSVNRSMTFSELKELLETSDGNLSVHARKLEDAGYVACKKSFVGRTPKTEFRITAKGRRSLERYLEHMEALIEATRGK